MTRRCLSVLVLMLMLAVLPFVAIVPANAHARALFYFEWWHTGERSVVWHFDDGFPLGDARARVRDGAAVWNNQATSLQFSFDSSDLGNQSWLTCPTQTDRITVFWIDVADPGVDVFGQTMRCDYNSDGTRT